MRSTSTRLLLTCAAIGVGAGIPFTVTGYLHGVVVATLPIIYGAMIGLYFLPGVIAQSLLRRGGVALLTSLMAGITAAAFNPVNIWRHLGTALLIGALQEMPFALSRYRVWRAWVFYLAAGVAGVIMGTVVLIALGIHHFAPVAEIISIAIWVGSPILMTWIGRAIAAGIDRTGAARGLQGPMMRGPGRTRSSSLHMAIA